MLNEQDILGARRRVCQKVFERLSFWHERCGEGFYKFIQPCPHPEYREGDSWCEEVGVSEKTLRKYMREICTSHRGPRTFFDGENPFGDKPFASFYDPVDRKTYFFRHEGNFKRFQSLFANVYTSPSQKISEPFRVGGAPHKQVNSFQKENNLPPKSPIEDSEQFQGDVGSLDSPNFDLKKSTSSNDVPHGEMRKPLREQGRGDLSEESWKTAQQMHQIWRDQTSEFFETPRLTPKFGSKLVRALKDHFSDSMEQWRAYCQSVASSEFLMGKVKDFKAWLVWVIRPDVVQKVKSGLYGIKVLFTQAKAVLKPSKEEVSAAIEGRKEPEILKNLRHQILEKVGEGAYRSWFEGLEFEEEGGVFTVIAPNAFVMEGIQARYGTLLHQIFSSLGLLTNSERFFKGAV